MAGIQRWLLYSDRVTISSCFTPLPGMRFNQASNNEPCSCELATAILACCCHKLTTTKDLWVIPAAIDPSKKFALLQVLVNQLFSWKFLSLCSLIYHFHQISWVAGSYRLESAKKNVECTLFNCAGLCCMPASSYWRAPLMQLAVFGAWSMPLWAYLAITCSTANCSLNPISWNLVS